MLSGTVESVGWRNFNNLECFNFLYEFWFGARGWNSQRERNFLCYIFYL